MNLSRLCAFKNHSNRSSLLCGNEMLLKSCNSKKRRNRSVIFINFPVGENKNIRSLTISLVSVNKKTFYSFFKGCSNIICYRNNGSFKSLNVHALDLEHISSGKDRIFYFQNTAVIRSFFKNVSVLADINARIGNDLLTDSIERRVCYLSKKLAEIIEKRNFFLVKRRKRNIRTHRSDRFCAFFSHRKNAVLYILIRVTESFLKLSQFITAVAFYILVRNMKIMQTNEICIKPFAVRLT